jgi:citrate-Mg2+:H+ or citrate-Ca2+:H+ symporter, CitMHS family
MTLALVGFAMVIVFMTLVMTKRLSAITALALIPCIFAVAIGAGTSLGEHVMGGIQQVAPTAVMLVFAILYFGLMIDAGLFDPLVNRIIAWVGDDPVRVTVGHTMLASIVALDGDGTTTLLVCASAMLPIYRRLGMNPLIFALIGGLCSTIMNLIPWGGPSARAAAALHVDVVADLFVPLIPAMGVGLVVTLAIAYWFGLRERKRLAGVKLARAGSDEGLAEAALAVFDRDPAALRPKLWLFNLALTLAMMVAVVLGVAPSGAIFMIAFAIALLVNYPRLDDQRARLTAHASTTIAMVVMILAAGVFTGVLNGAGMVDAMAEGLIAVVPAEFGPHFALVTALLAMPLQFFLSNDAYYFGVVPVLAETGAHYGVSPEAIGRASLLGLPVHGLSPFIAPIYLKAAILKVDLADLQRFCLHWAALISLVLIAAAALTGAFPWRA